MYRQMSSLQKTVNLVVTRVTSFGLADWKAASRRYKSDPQLLSSALLARFVWLALPASSRLSPFGADRLGSAPGLSSIPCAFRASVAAEMESTLQAS